MTPEQQRELYPLTTIARNQERLQAILQLLSVNAPKKFICETMHVGWYTLQSIAQKNGEKIADIKKRIAPKAALFVELGVEQMLEDLQAGRLDPDKLALNLKLVFDVLQLVTGEATVNVGTVADGKRLSADGLRERLASMKRALPTGSDGRNISTTAAADQVVDLDPARTDIQSTPEPRK